MPPVVSRRVAVPPGWRREVKEGRVHYFSPDCRCMMSAEDVLRHLLSSGTCKCGLPCPFHLENVFNFDPHLESSHNDSSFALHSTPLPAPGVKHCCTVMSCAVDEVKQHPTDTIPNQPCGTSGATDAEGLPLLQPGANRASTLSLSVLSSRVETVTAPRRELIPSEQSSFPSVYVAGDVWQGLQSDPMPQAPPIAQHFSHTTQHIPSNVQQPQQWGTPARPVAVPRLPASLYETANPAPPTYPRQHHEYGVAYDSSMQPAPYYTDLNPRPVEAQFGSQYCGDSQPPSCLSFTPLSSHSASMTLPQQYPHTQSHQGYPSSVYPPTSPWAARQQDPSPQSWQHVAVPLKEIANECAAMFGGVPVQSVLEPPYTQQQQGSTPQATAMTAPRAQHSTFTASLLTDDAQRSSEKFKETPSPQTAVEAYKEPVLARSESNAQCQPVHNPPQWTMTGKPATSGELSSHVRARSSVSSCSSSSSSDSSSSVSSSGGEEMAKGTSNGNHRTIHSPLMVSYPREKVDSWLKKEEGLLEASLQPHEELSMAVRIPLSVLPGRMVSNPVSPGCSTPSQPDIGPLCPEPHPLESMGFESGSALSEELWVKIKLGMTQKQPEVLCDRQIGGIIENREMGANPPSSPPAIHVPPSRGKRIAKRGTMGEKEGSSASPDAGFSPLELARMDRTLLGLRPRGKTLSYQQQAEKGDTVTADQSRRTKQLGLKESPPHSSPLPPCKKRHSEDFEAYLPKGVDMGDLSHLSFVDGSLVWAKGKGLPFWPGMVCAATELDQTPPAPGKHWVRWFGDSTFSEAEESHMKPLAEGMAHYVNALERKKGIKDRQRLLVAFKEAFKAIRNANKEEEFTVEEESIHSGEETSWQ